jgi:Sec-independent protein translocase protein TatA
MPGMPVDLLFILIIILVLVLMWKGPKNLPKLGEALGRGVKEARVEASKAQAEIQGRVDDTTPPDTTPPAPPAEDGQRPA